MTRRWSTEICVVARPPAIQQLSHPKWVMDPNTIVAAIPVTTPFVGPETLEREMGHSFDLRLGANESLFGPSPHAIEAMQEQAARGHLYCDPEGYRLRSEIASRNNCAIDHVVLGSGIDDLLMTFCRAFLSPGDKAVTTRGSYPTFEYAVRSVGGELVYAEYQPDRVDVPALVLRAKSETPKMLYIANPDNPSGSWHEPDQIWAHLKSVPAATLVILDEAYWDFACVKDHLDTDNRQVVRMRTFSKGHGMAGLRIGYALGHADTIGAVNKIRLHFGVNSVAQAGALAAYRDTGHLEHVVKETRRLEKWTRMQLKAMGFASPVTSANFLLIDLETKGRAEACLVALRQERVFVRKPALPPLDRFIRVTIGPQPVMEEFLRRFKGVVDGLG